MRTTIPLRQNGRIVIPQPIRNELALDYGDLVEVELRAIPDPESSSANHE